MKIIKVTGLMAAVVLTCWGARAAEPSAPLNIERLQTRSATVQSVDMQHRLVSLATADGRTTTVAAGPEVRNLAQVKAGDKVVVRYYEALAVEILPKGSSSTLAHVDATGGSLQAQPGEKPGAAAGTKATTTVVIDSVDKAANKVAFKGPGGLLRTVDVKDPKAQKFVQTLKKGDEVEVTYTEALAVSVEPAG